MRILHTVEFYHPHVGGAERVVQRISEGLVRRGHEVVVATSWHPERGRSAVNGVQIVPFRVSGNLARGMAGEVARYQDWLRRERFDIVMNYAAQTWPTDAALAVLPDLEAGRVLATCGFSGLRGARRLLYLRYFRQLRRLIRDYDALVYHAEAGADVAFGGRYGRGEQVVIPNGADGAEFAGPSDFRVRYGIRARHLLLHVGNHYRVKGHGDLARVLRALAGRDVAMVIIGDDPGGARSCWRTCLAAARRDRRLVLLRQVPRSDVVTAFCAADLVLLTSRFEAAPLVLVEAMAAGVPFVSYDVGNARALEGGQVVAGPEAMAAAVADLLGDDARRRALGDAGRNHQRRALEWETIVGQYETLYASLVIRRAQGR
ncbi:MAG: glycosyltransferase family 4 protein [Armatimonadota bacterium]|nr:glycosyltransferase family 4 protein [Armatimonadota bacterium]MDR7519570.1 glycosyltransferase family 4 protein [Armatimonadota bacterium]MDR7550141.1 glycosyltransferase family 4 protein [Armatimonadota bacterium]